jgi:hypothetical protein
MYRVLTWASYTQQAEGRIGEFHVSDQPKNYRREDRWPAAAVFVVSMRHDQETQERRAREYAAYLNKGLVVQPPIGEQ